MANVATQCQDGSTKVAIPLDLGQQVVANRAGWMIAHQGQEPPWPRPQYRFGLAGRLLRWLDGE